MHVGTITKLFHDGEYGLITKKGGEKIHFHKHCLWNIQFKELTEKQEVEFEIQSAYNGFLAFHIRPVLKSPH